MDANDIDFTQLESQCEKLICKDHTETNDIVTAIADASVVISNKIDLNADVLAQCKTLRLICISATGTNNVDLEAAKSLGIKVCNVKAYATSSVVQHVFALILNLHARLNEIGQAVANGEWCKSKHFSLLTYPFTELADKKFAIYGYGELGQAVAKVAEAFGMQVLIAKRDKSDTREGRVDFDELLAQADVLTVHCPLTTETENLITKKEFELMKPSSILINAARGGIVNEADLIEALKNKQIAGAGVDVLTMEPPDENHPLIKNKLPNLIVTPHVAWASRESRQRLINEVAKNIEAFRNGEQRNLVV